jgi:CheY-like chemotaxis protein
MPDGGTVTISACSEQMGAGYVLGLPSGEYVCIAVSDTGVGMEEATLKRATEPFFTTKSAGQGTGLGLSVVDGLVAQSGGAMRIRSNPGAGTTVELRLPACAASKRERLAKSPPSVHSAGPCRVLLVEDDPIVAAGTAEMLTELGHAVIVVGSAQHALEVLQGETGVNVVITDHAMPCVTGADLAAQIRSRWPELPVGVVSGYIELAAQKPDDIPRLAKPYRLADLAALVARLVGQREAPAGPEPRAS